MQGEAYRIIYLHVPCAASAFLASAILAVFGLWGITRRSETALIYQRATAEVGFLFTVATLITGSIWGRPIWGTWWTWDARLTTTLLLAILYFGYLVLYTSMAPDALRTRVCSVLALIIFVDVPIIYKSVNWWRTLHQPQTILRDGGSTMDPVMLQALMFSVLAMLTLITWLIIARARNLATAERVESISQNMMQGK